MRCTNTNPIMDERNASFFRFEDLRVYTKAIDYSKWVINTLGPAANEGQTRLSAAFCTSAFDIELNIAEGSSRAKSQFEHYLKIAKTAIRECVIYTSIANRCHMLTDEQMEQSREYLMELTRMVGAFIVSLQRPNHNHRPNDYNGEDEDVLDEGNDTPRNDLPSDE